MSTNVINPTDLVAYAAQLTPKAVIGNPGSDVSLVDLKAQGINNEFIEAHLALGRKLTEIPGLWNEFVRKQNAKLMQDSKPAVAPYNSKAACDASKRSVHVPYQSAPVPENETPEQELARLRAENERLLKGKSRGKLQVRMSADKVAEDGTVENKRTVVLVGLRRFPIGFFADEWLAILEAGDTIRTFIEDNRSALSFK